MASRSPRQARGGKLRIGDDWNAIRIIALSQNNPLKAVAEFVENSIDAGAGQITITRGREKGKQYLQIVDDGSGVPKDPEGRPNFRYVATHICDSITVTDSLLPAGRDTGGTKQEGLPGYTFERAPGKLWRSRFDAGRNLIVINNGHRDFVFASRNKALKLRYITRLYAKELVLKNFPGLPTSEMLERLIELSMYTEENLRGA